MSWEQNAYCLHRYSSGMSCTLWNMQTGCLEICTHLNFKPNKEHYRKVGCWNPDKRRASQQSRYTVKLSDCNCLLLKPVPPAQGGYQQPSSSSPSDVQSTSKPLDPSAPLHNHIFCRLPGLAPLFLVKPFTLTAGFYSFIFSSSFIEQFSFRCGD